MPPGSSTSSVARFSNASVVMIAAAKSASPSAAQRAGSRREPGGDDVAVELHADHAGRGDGDLVLAATPAIAAAAPCMRARLVEPGPPVAALALPELAATARSASSRQRSRVTSTGAACTPER